MIQGVVGARGIPVAILCSVLMNPGSISSSVTGLNPPMIALHGFDRLLPLYSLTDITLDDPGLTEGRVSDILAAENIYRLDLFDEKKISPIIFNFNDELKKYLSKHPELLYLIPSRRFEELIASILEDSGFKVELTLTLHKKLYRLSSYV